MNKKRLRVFCSGPISSRNPFVYWRNLCRGIRVEASLAYRGYAPFPVFVNFLWHWFSPVTREDYYAIDLEWLKYADALLALKGWWHSPGAKEEIRHAEMWNIPVFYRLETLEAWREEKCGS